ncbi:MAG: AbrB/MazE/SpoVT family DNA-binding domain-containing protein [Gammaproteobacteria bacterium]|nr:AbrB/MazE/SpoVT family DNA-binding domain-containing protein [Gammaproteobacteria bacterium]
MQTQIQKWGNSLGVRIPVSLCYELHLHAGSIVELALEDEHLVVQPKKHSLEEMLKKITPHNRHNPLFEDLPRGAEEW